MDRLLEVARKVYNNREKESSRRQQQNLLAVIQGREQGFFNPRGRGRGSMRGRERGRGFYNLKVGVNMERLGYNQCANCKQEGHWKNECPLKGGQFMSPRNPFVGSDVAKAMVLGEYDNHS